MNDDVSFPPPDPPRRARLRRAEASQSPAMPPADAAQQPPEMNGPVSDSTPIRRSSRGSSSPTATFSAWKSLETVFSVALLVATLFTLWTPANLFANNFFDRMFQAMQSQPGPASVMPTPTASPRPRIGLVAGHWGNGQDTGAVCKDGLTEVSLNLKIATMVQGILVKEGFDVDLLKEFDSRLTEYRALALVSIHNDSCDYINDQATGFKVAAAKSSVFPEKATRLTACLSQRYQAITGMSFHYGSVTNDMTNYHAFNEIHSDTTAAIIETGFMNLDRDKLTNHTDMIAQGVASGILCFVRNENVPQVPTVQP
jgi:N-acetylmuramoyl-L-alanine amidase